jgi:hypothetical protein
MRPKKVRVEGVLLRVVLRRGLGDARRCTRAAGSNEGVLITRRNHSVWRSSLRICSAAPWRPPQAYLQFLPAGLLVQTVLLTTIYSGFAANTDITKSNFDRFRSMPIWNPSPIVGRCSPMSSGIRSRR